MIQPAELAESNNYKIGCSRNTSLSRILNGYKKGSRYISINECINPFILEKQLIKIFRENFKLIAGNEFFKGDEMTMLEIFMKTVTNYNKSNYEKMKDVICNTIKENIENKPNDLLNNKENIENKPNDLLNNKQKADIKTTSELVKELAKEIAKELKEPNNKKLNINPEKKEYLKPNYIQILYKNPELFNNKSFTPSELFNIINNHCQKNNLSKCNNLITFGKSMTAIFKDYKKRTLSSYKFNFINVSKNKFNEILYNNDKEYFKHINNIASDVEPKFEH